MTRPRVLITGVGGRSVGHQILQALLLLSDPRPRPMEPRPSESGHHSRLAERYEIVVTDADAFSYGLYQVKDRYIVPRARDPRYLDAIRALILKERIDIVLPGTE